MKKRVEQLQEGDIVIILSHMFVVDRVDAAANNLGFSCKVLLKDGKGEILIRSANYLQKEIDSGIAEIIVGNELSRTLYVQKG
jgi:hypothetical protein